LKLTNCLKTYQEEARKLSREHPDNYSPLRLIVQFPAWYRCLTNSSSPVQDEIPWITFTAISFLKRILTRDKVVFEFGSGGSTLFFAPRVKQIHSVEHDEPWFATVSEAIKNKGYSNWFGRIAQPADSLSAREKSVSDPEAYLSGSPAYQGFSFEHYVKSIDLFPDGCFDLILIDGRARPSCFKHAVPKVKAGGYIMWDNTDRAYYLSNIQKYEANFVKTDFPGPSPYVNFFTQTSVWLKTR
jgi:hypothetical protein